MDMLTSPADAPSPIPSLAPPERSDTRAPAGTAAQAAPTTLKYKFDWLLQRQVNAGTMSADKAAAMIKLFDAATGSAPATSQEGPAKIEATDTSTGSGEDQPDPKRDSPPAATDRLLDDLRDHFTATGP
ncbi:hypothetical protein ASG67_07960 [Sphingomonas sp. Leaf339]|uniref:hypothetical protein n=1 Tax=Sphingomonas sp. Leaf339 TaxID=1736343 RepID=UPI0006FDCF51|nr:hypothetical protein [Sphingomonas sp. Leaf339]KQU56002.1 hypothetical protein ASG67_07960 [Sphingomonas sp. Leaf339]